MPTLEDYRALAPFTLEELVEAANAVLRDKPRLKVSARTVRYYVSQGVVPSPTGAPKFARYGYEHLARLVGARLLLDEGRTLETARQNLNTEFKRGAGADFVAGLHREQIQPVLAPAAAASQSRLTLSEPARTQTPRPFVRYELAPDITLEVPADQPPHVSLPKALIALQTLIDNLRDST